MCRPRYWVKSYGIVSPPKYWCAAWVEPRNEVVPSSVELRWRPCGGPGDHHAALWSSSWRAALTFPKCASSAGAGAGFRRRGAAAPAPGTPTVPWAEVAVDPDRIQDGRWVHDAMVECWQMNPHHQDQVTAVLARGACSKNPGSYQGQGADSAMPSARQPRPCTTHRTVAVTRRCM